MRVREKNDITQWFKFFLVGVVETAKNSIATFDKILKLQQEIDVKLQNLGSRSANANLIVKQLYQHPIIQAQKAKEITGLSMPSVYKLLDELENLKIIHEVTGAKRGRIFFFREYIKLFSNES